MAGQQAGDIGGRAGQHCPDRCSACFRRCVQFARQCVHSPARIRPNVFTFPAKVFTFGADVFTVTRRGRVRQPARDGEPFPCRGWREFEHLMVAPPGMLGVQPGTHNGRPRRDTSLSGTARTVSGTQPGGKRWRGPFDWGGGRAWEAMVRVQERIACLDCPDGWAAGALWCDLVSSAGSGRAYRGLQTGRISRLTTNGGGG